MPLHIRTKSNGKDAFLPRKKERDDSTMHLFTSLRVSAHKWDAVDIHTAQWSHKGCVFITHNTLSAGFLDLTCLQSGLCLLLSQNGSVWKWNRTFNKRHRLNGEKDHGQEPTNTASSRSSLFPCDSMYVVWPLFFISTILKYVAIGSFKDSFLSTNSRIFVEAVKEMWREEDTENRTKRLSGVRAGKDNLNLIQITETNHCDERQCLSLDSGHGWQQARSFLDDVHFLFPFRCEREDSIRRFLPAYTRGQTNHVRQGNASRYGWRKWEQNDRKSHISGLLIAWLRGTKDYGQIFVRSCGI